MSESSRHHNNATDRYAAYKPVKPGNPVLLAGVVGR